MKQRFRTLYKRLKENTQLPEMKILPGQLAFFFILTLVPTIAITLVIASNFNISSEVLESLVNKQFPEELIKIVQYVSNNSVQVNLVIFFASALILASNGTYSMIIASNQIYKIKSKGIVYDRLKSIFMLLILVFLLIFIMIVPVFGNFIIKGIGVIIDNDTFINQLHMIYKIINVPISWFFMFVLIKLLYTIAPDKRIPSQNVTYGALFTSFSWVVFTKFYSIYVDVFNNYTTLYGSISSLIILMWWIYFLSYLYVMGIALNISKYKVKNLFNEN